MSEIVYGNLLYPQDDTPDEAVLSSIRAARDAGVTTFDTADVYGMFRSETLLGRALAGEPREDLVLCTKVGMPTGRGPNGQGLSRKHITESVDGSLRRLRVDHIDVYTAHRYDPATPLEELMWTFSDLVRAGKILYVGMSEWPVEHITEAARIGARIGVPVISHMPRYSMLWRVPEAEVIPVCDDLGIGQICYFTLEQGVLTGKYPPGARPPSGTRATAPKGGRAPLMRRWLDDDTVLGRVQQLRPLADEAGLTPAQLALAWVLQNPGVCGAVIGSSGAEQVLSNVKAAGVGLDSELMTRIDAALGDSVVHTE